MKGSYPLRARIIIFFCVYLGIFLVIYSAAISGLINIAQDFAFEKQLVETSKEVIDSVKSTGKLPESLPRHFQLYLDKTEMPPFLASYIEDSDSGCIEINTADDLSYHVGIFKIPSNNMRFFLVYNVGAYEISEQFEFKFDMILLAVGLCILLAGGLMSLAISKQIMTPITLLAKSINSFSPDEPFKPLSDYKADDEIGLLVNTINDLIRRIALFVQREREFTMFASHELRNPISVIKGATEVILADVKSENHKLVGPLERINISVKELETLINTFLMLARQNQMCSVDGDVYCKLKSAMENSVAANRYLLDGKSVEVILDIKDAGTVSAPEAVVTIAVGNLIRNSFQYTLSGRVTITGKGDLIQVRDTGPGLESPKPETGSGLGLLIVTRLCERMGWRHKISTLPNGGTMAELIFSCNKPEAGSPV